MMVALMAVWRAVWRVEMLAANLVEKKVGMKVDRMVLQWVGEMDECKVREKVGLKGIVEVVCSAY